MSTGSREGGGGILSGTTVVWAEAKSWANWCSKAAVASKSSCWSSGGSSGCRSGRYQGPRAYLTANISLRRVWMTFSKADNLRRSMTFSAARSEEACPGGGLEVGEGGGEIVA